LTDTYSTKRKFLDPLAVQRNEKEQKK